MPPSMSAGLTKRESLDRVHTEFLINLAEELNGDYFGSYKDYQHYSRGKLLDIVSNKLTVDEIENVRSGYLLCKNAEEIAFDIKPTDTKKIRTLVGNHFAEQAVYEAKVDGRYCDIVFPDTLIAVEIKSARDKIDRAVDQVEDYSIWADKVYLAYDQNHRGSIPPKLVDSGTGLLEVEDGELEEVQKPHERETGKEELLPKFTLEYLRYLSKRHDLAYSGKKYKVIHRIKSHLSEDIIRKEFKEFLKQRGALEV
jgi:hypothetical protein